MDVFLSYLIYMSVFSISLLFFKVSEQLYEGRDSLKKRSIRSILLFVAVLLPCLLAAYRADNVGVDVENTLLSLKRASQFDSFHNMYSTMISNSEPLYIVLIYFLSRVASSEWLLLFVLQLLVILPILIAAIKMRERLSITMVMLTYFFCFYNNSYNLMRQSVACAFIILGVVNLLTRNYRMSFGSIFSLVMAALFHKAAVIGIMSIIIIYLISKSNIRRVLRIAVYLVAVMLPTLLFSVIGMIESKSLLSDRYSYYANVYLYQTIDRGYIVNPFSIYNLVDMFFRITLVVIPVLFTRKHKINDIDYVFFRTLLVTGILVFIVILVTLNINYGQRLSMFFDMFLVLYIPYSLRKPNIRLKKAITSFSLIGYWTIWVMIMGWSGSNIYSLRI